MRILRKATNQEDSSIPQTEKDYDHLAAPQDPETIRIITLVCMDNDSFPIMIEEWSDSLTDIKGFLEEIYPEKKAHYGISSFEQCSFAFMLDETLRGIPADYENWPMISMINEMNLKIKVKKQSLKLYLVKGLTENEYFHANVENSFIFHVHIEYGTNPIRYQKRLMIKKQGQIEVLILSTNGFIEDHIKLRNLQFSESGTTICFENNLDISDHVTKKLTFKVHFQDEHTLKDFLQHLQELLNIFNKPKEVEIHVQVNCKKYEIKKENRFGFNQKRTVWFDQQTMSFNIATRDMKNKKTFQLSQIKTFIRTKKPNKIIVDFHDKKLKKLILIFDKVPQLDEFLKTSEDLTKVEGVLKLEAIESAFAQSSDNNRFRRFSWLDSKNTQAVGQTRSSTEFAYNVIQRGRISHEKRVILLDTAAATMVIKNQQGQEIKSIKISDLKINKTFKNLFKVQLYTYNACFTFLFSSAYSKYHFTSVFLMGKWSEKVRPREMPLSEETTIMTLTWNLSSTTIPTLEVLSSILSGTTHYGLIAISFQQCIYDKVQAWVRQLMIFYRASNHYLAAGVTLDDIFLVVFMHPSLKKYTSKISTFTTYFSEGENRSRKGGVCVTFRIESSSFCFLGAHLPSKPSRSRQRNKCLQKLLEYKRKLVDVHMTHECDYVFLMGDLAYSLDMDKEEAQENIHDLHKLKSKDQLTRVISENMVLSSFKEGPLTFPPTYPAYNSHEAPAWTDRILYKQNIHLIQDSYETITTNSRSLHKPVRSSFKCMIKSWYVPPVLRPITQVSKLVRIRFVTLSAIFYTPINAHKTWLSFYSPFLEEYPNPVAVNINNERELSFAIENKFFVGFSYISVDFFNDKHLTFLIKQLKEDNTVDVIGSASVPLTYLVQSISGFSPEAAETIARIKSAVGFTAPLESRTTVIGEIKGTWRFKIFKN
ncbi:hypothetical protein SteCoe_31533 [Stentor coeruleus]|uniref:Inositol polyphosphate-related phosphatase domain-containing protein n=1 Tax=Stentor coeruleus TaxID=5963 RepID=A0A1R2B149_9CILI|nr:hypothetical protein SteCoe_31533 [Stentor coeruleus]